MKRDEKENVVKELESVAEEYVHNITNIAIN